MYCLDFNDIARGGTEKLFCVRAVEFIAVEYGDHVFTEGLGEAERVVKSAYKLEIPLAAAKRRFVDPRDGIRKISECPAPAGGSRVEHEMTA